MVKGEFDMEKALKDFLISESQNYDAGYVKFQGNYYAFFKESGDYVFTPVEYSVIERSFKILAEEKINFFFKVLEGFIHNSNGKITPVFSRLGLLESKIEETKDLPEFRGVDRIFQKIVKSTKELMDIYELMSGFMVYYGLEEKGSLNLKRFFDGLHHALITDREIKHKVVFNFQVEEYINISVNNRDFTKAVYFLAESVLSLVRGKEDVLNFSVSVEKGEKTAIMFSFEKKPFEISGDENLNWDTLKSVMLYKLFKDIAEKNAWNISETPEGLRVEV